MQGIPLPLAPQNFADVNFSPGILRGHIDECMVAKDEIATVKEATLQRWRILCNGNWKSVWYGVPYEAAARAYKEQVSRVPETRARYASSIWRLEDSPTDYDMEVVTRYYAIIDEVRGRPDWSRYDVYEHLIYLPIPAALPPAGKKLVRYPPPQERGMSREVWEQHCARGGDPLYVPDVVVEEESEDEMEAEDEDAPPSVGGQDEENENEEDEADDGRESMPNDEEEDQDDDSDHNVEDHDLIGEAPENEASLGPNTIDGQDAEQDVSGGDSVTRTPRRKRKAKGSPERWLSPEDVGEGETPESQVRRMMAASQSPQSRPRSRKQFTVPARIQGEYLGSYYSK